MSVMTSVTMFPTVSARKLLRLLRETLLRWLAELQAPVGHAATHAVPSIRLMHISHFMALPAPHPTGEHARGGQNAGFASHAQFAENMDQPRLRMASTAS